jgi:hypothetical protein
VACKRQYGDAKIEKVDGVWRMFIWRNDHWMMLSYTFNTRQEARDIDKSSR